MICLADTDIILKLAACDLLSQTLTVLSVTRKEVFVYKEEALRVYQYEPEILQQYSAEVRKHAIVFVKEAGGIYSAIDPDEQAAMQAAGIDTGEQVIFGATRDSTEFWVVTADRKALRKLAPAPLCAGICTRLRNRVLSLDQILLLLIRKFGHSSIQPLIEPHIRCDIAMEAAFARGVNAEEAEKRLQERIRVLRIETFDLIALD